MPSPQALAAAREIEDNLVWGRMEPERVEQRAAIIDRHFSTPNAALPPLDPDARRRKMVIEIEVADDFEHRLDNQWMVEREIAADRWSWKWAP